jgi:rhodanese-related sulfurtransferase
MLMPLENVGQLLHLQQGRPKVVLVDVCNYSLSERPAHHLRIPMVRPQELVELHRQGTIPVLFCKKGITARATAERLVEEGMPIVVFLEFPVSELQGVVPFTRFYGD